jgi:hypothetical protein
MFRAQPASSLKKNITGIKNTITPNSFVYTKKNTKSEQTSGILSENVSLSFSGFC